MAQEGVAAIAKFAKDGIIPANPPGKDFTDTGVNLITDQPQAGEPAKDTSFGAANCGAEPESSRRMFNGE